MDGLVNEYYNRLFTRYGAIPAGVDWGRGTYYKDQFENHLRMIKSQKTSAQRLSLLDFGCGYGAFADYLIEHGYIEDITYVGFDLVGEMIEYASKKHRHSCCIEFVSDLDEKRNFDFIIANGVFNVKCGINDELWIDYVYDQIETLFNLCKVGLSVNFLDDSIPHDLRHDDYYGEGVLAYFDSIALHRFIKEKLSIYVDLHQSYLKSEFMIQIYHETIGDGYLKKK